MRILGFLFVALCFAACTRQENGGSYDPRPATGKGNGGDGLKMSKKTIRTRIESMKPSLKLVFEGLHDLAIAEKILPGSTALEKYPQLLDLINKMTDSTKSVFLDIATADNFKIQDVDCLDIYGVAKAAATTDDLVGSAFCFSARISDLRSSYRRHSW